MGRTVINNILALQRTDYLLFPAYWPASRLIAGLFVGAAFLSVLFTQQAQLIAEALGVGRRADQVLYILLATFAFAWALIYSARMRTQDNLTRLIRQMAIDSAEVGGRSQGSVSDDA